MSTFGDRFKKLRLLKNLTQEQLAEDFNAKYGYSFNKATISQYENNKRTPEITGLMNFIDYFNVSLDYLLCNDSYNIKEISGEYYVGDNLNIIELESLIEMIKNMIKNNKIKLQSDNLSSNQIHTLNNCLDIAVELVKRT